MTPILSRGTRRLSVLASGLAALLATSVVCSAQSIPNTPPSEIPLLEIAPVEIRTFEPPIRPPGAGREAAYREALVLEAEVSKRALDALPPSMQPYLYIGTREVPIFEVTQGSEPDLVRLVFHVPRWQDLPARAPLVLTIDRGAPQRDADRYRERRDLHRFEQVTIAMEELAPDAR